jgi:hypothetical protein
MVRSPTAAGKSPNDGLGNPYPALGGTKREERKKYSVKVFTTFFSMYSPHISQIMFATLIICCLIRHSRALTVFFAKFYFVSASSVIPATLTEAADIWLTRVLLLGIVSDSVIFQ